MGNHIKNERNTRGYIRLARANERELSWRLPEEESKEDKAVPAPVVQESTEETGAWSYAEEQTPRVDE